MANKDLDAHITGHYGEDQFDSPSGRKRGFGRYEWMDDQPDEAWGSDETDKEDDNETV